MAIVSVPQSTGWLAKLIANDQNQLVKSISSNVTTGISVLNGFTMSNQYYNVNQAGGLKFVQIGAVFTGKDIADGTTVQVAKFPLTWTNSLLETADLTYAGGTESGDSTAEVIRVSTDAATGTVSITAVGKVYSAWKWGLYKMFICKAD